MSTPCCFAHMPLAKTSHGLRPTLPGGGRMCEGVNISWMLSNFSQHHSPPTIYLTFLDSFFFPCPSANLKCIPSSIAYLSRLTYYFYPLSQTELLIVPCTLFCSIFLTYLKSKNRMSLPSDAQNILGDSIIHPSVSWMCTSSDHSTMPHRYIVSLLPSS